jgi:2-C-methyl-D-erythritol 2,4-cyclodiphosphate synthase
MTIRTGRNKRQSSSGSRFAAGIGQDSHAFESRRSAKPLVLAGVTIPGCPGLAGNSDADVILHAITNAVSGITGVNILGPIADRLCLDRDIRDSGAYLEKALKTLGRWRLAHVSVAIEAKRPRLVRHIDAMRASIARLCSLPLDDVGITATSGEGLTPFGRGLGIQAFAVVTAQRGRR